MTLEPMEQLKEELGEEESQGVCMSSDGEDRGCLQEGEFSKREEIRKKALCWRDVF